MQKKPPNWNNLYSRLLGVYLASGQTRKKAVLENHVHKKEIICRKLGIVSEADVVRIANSLGVGPTQNRLPVTTGQLLNAPRRLKEKG